MEEQNIILYDWLSFTHKVNDPFYIISVLGLDGVDWQQVKGARGYHDRLYFDCISIHYNGRNDMGCWCEMSGQGCRAFETYSDLPNKWPDLFQAIQEDRMKITRLDVAFDDHTGVLDIDRLLLDTQNQEYVSKSRDWSVTVSSKGKTIDIGSPKSDVYIRIYDKAAERNCDPGTHWIRCELQLRDERAQKFATLTDTVNPWALSLGSAYCGVMINYLRYVDPDPLDSNRWRWPIKEYWGDFLADAQSISLYTAPGVDYNLDQCKRYVIRQAGNAIDAYIQIKGVEQFLHDLENRPVRRNPKYDQLISRYKDCKL